MPPASGDGSPGNRFVVLWINTPMLGTGCGPSIRPPNPSVPCPKNVYIQNPDGTVAVYGSRNLYAECLIPPRREHFVCPAGPTLYEECAGSASCDGVGQVGFLNDLMRACRSCDEPVGFPSPYIDAAPPNGWPLHGNGILLAFAERDAARGVDVFRRFAGDGGFTPADGMTATMEVDRTYDPTICANAPYFCSARKGYPIRKLEIRNGPKRVFYSYSDAAAKPGGRWACPTTAGKSNCGGWPEPVSVSAQPCAVFRLWAADDFCRTTARVAVSCPGNQGDCPPTTQTVSPHDGIAATMVDGWIWYTQLQSPRLPNGQTDPCAADATTACGGFNVGSLRARALWGCDDFPQGRDPLTPFSGGKPSIYNDGCSVTVTGL